MLYKNSCVTVKNKIPKGFKLQIKVNFYQKLNLIQSILIL